MLGARGASIFTSVPGGNLSHKFTLKINKILTALKTLQLFLPLECQFCSGTKWKFAAKYLNRQQLHMALATALHSPNGAVAAIKRSQVLRAATEILSRQGFCQKQTAMIFCISTSIFFCLGNKCFYLGIRNTDAPGLHSKTNILGRGTA